MITKPSSPMLSMDLTSTIDQTLLNSLSIYTLPPTYRLGSCGNGCLLEPPGHPSYFTQMVFTKYGNLPSHHRHAPLYLINGRVVRYADEPYEESDGLLDRLYKPLAEEHPRVQAWIEEMYRHLHHCYTDPSAVQAREIVIYPVPSYRLVGKTHDQPAEIEAYALSVALPDNHRAVRAIRKWYPDHKARLDLIEHPVARFQADWWSRYAHLPEADECPGHLGWWPHGKNGVCRLCGRTGIEAIV